MQAVFSGPELCRRQAHEVVALLKSGEISPRDCLDAAFARIAEVEPAINAMPTICPERAYDAAVRSCRLTVARSLACRASACDQGSEHGLRRADHLRHDGIFGLCAGRQRSSGNAA